MSTVQDRRAIAAAKAARRRDKQKKVLKKVIAYILLSAGSIVMVVPFIWTMSTSFKDDVNIQDGRWWPQEFTPEPYLLTEEDHELLAERIRTVQPEVQDLYRDAQSRMEQSEQMRRDARAADRDMRESMIAQAEALAAQAQARREDAARLVQSEVTTLISGLLSQHRMRARRSSIAEPVFNVSGRIAERINEIDTAEITAGNMYWFVDKVQPSIWDNFMIAWVNGKFGYGYRNSFLVAFFVTFGQVLTGALAAYAFARLKFPGRDQLFLGYLGTMMIPFVVIMIPNFIILKEVGLIDTLPGVILPVTFSAFGTFMLRQFFIGIPRDLEEAAIIDGANKLNIFFRIIIPLSKAAIATLTTFSFIFQWNDFMWPLVVIHSDEVKTLPLLLTTFQGSYSAAIPLIMAASLIVLLPVILIYIFNQKFITKGITLSGLKG